MLKIIKTAHTLVWIIMVSACFYILYAGLTNTFDLILVISIILLTLETLVLILNKWTCPFTPLAQKYTTEKSHNFDIYIPSWLAKYNKLIFGIIFAVGIMLVIFNWIARQ